VVSGVLENCERRRGRGISQCARERGEGEGVREEGEELHRVRIVGVWRRKVRTPARKFSSPTAPFAEGKERSERGDPGLL
jgi:hypothetical protein